MPPPGPKNPAGSLAADTALARLRERLEARYALGDRLSALSYEHYLNQVVINSAPEPRRFAELAEPWQWDQARALGPAIESVCRLPTRRHYKGKHYFWRTMPRGHDKSSSIGRLMNWVLAYTPKNISAVVAAADREQAAYVTEFMQAEARLNPWLGRRLTFKINKVEGRNGSNLKVLAADQYGTFGLSNDIMIFDELTHWADDGLWNTLMSGLIKRPGCTVFVITNAGVEGTWQHKACENARHSPLWDFYEPKAPLAKWTQGVAFDEAVRNLPRSVVRRVFFNEWLSPGEDCGFITRGEAEACADRGRRDGLVRAERGDPETEYVAAVDYGPKKDRTVLTVGHRVGEGFVVDRMDVWEGKDCPNREVPIARVEAWVEDVRKAFPRVTFVFDPYQMLSVIQKFESVARIERFEPRAGKANYELAQTLRSAVVNGRLAWYPGCGDLVIDDRGVLKPHTLADEFAELIIQTTAAGYRLQHLPGHHDDRVCALGMAVWKAIGSFRRRPFILDERYF